ncbi:hypothetical protein AURDEDRAFT_166106 [Auricularia subglabra TFB-10046 SS5]|nr:hypothetical protein AURDEDRAFT_166106 [Auricularia subglabra TFB-10046 SS5]
MRPFGMAFPPVLQHVPADSWRTLLHRGACLLPTNQEDDLYDVFGDTWPIQETVPSLGGAGGTQLYSADTIVGHQPALRAVLGELLVSHTHLLSSVAEPWPYTMGLNIKRSANDLCQAQACPNLEGLVCCQLGQGREETRRVPETCDRLQDVLAALQDCTAGAKKENSMPLLTGPDVPMDAAAFLSDPGSDSMMLDAMPLTKQDNLADTHAWLDIRHYAEKVHTVGGRLSVDATLLLANPFDFGADIVMHSGECPAARAPQG